MVKETVKEHKTEIIIAGVAIISIAGAILIVNSGNLVKNPNIATLLKSSVKSKTKIAPIVHETTQNTVINIPSNEKVIDVGQHIRNLSKGYKASPEKLASAIPNGIELGTNQTWVEAYTKLIA